MTEPTPTSTTPATPAAPADAPVVPERPVRAPRPTPVGTAAVVSTAGVMVSLVALWLVAQLLVLSDLAHDRAQAILFRDFRVQLAETTAPLGPVVPTGDPVAILRIPAIDLEEVVVEGTSSGELLAGPGHQRDTVLPGQEGQSYVLGRAATYGAPFADLGDLEVGEPVEVTTSQGVAVLTVTGVRRDGDPRPAPLAAGSTRLTLVSAEGEGRFSSLTPERTVYVDAESADAFPAPPRAGGAIEESERAMATDPTALPLLALYLALLTALVLAVVAARQRWEALLVWTMAGPLAMALAWLTTDTVMRLLPNLV
ncbi:sortase [Nocardioides marinquilinus]|uniref:Sortase n=1 Tax=Nocardioides marinquilinus TaxID=1210400 RepID=A0ABP9Q510_9ACTN